MPNRKPLRHDHPRLSERWAVTVRILVGDCREMLATLPDQSVNCCVTSPPYFGLRDYGVDGQMGLEATPDEFVAGMVSVFREVRRALRDDGTLWLNIGDSYANDGKWGGHTGGKHAKALHCSPIGRQKKYTGLKPKDLIGIPWMLAFALRADGWYLRQEIIWHKPNPMPESVTDRCTKAHESLFLLSKSPRYYFDAKAIAEPSTDQSPGNVTHSAATEYEGGDEFHRTKGGLVAYAARKRQAGKQHKQDALGQQDGGYLGSNDPYETRNKRSVWTIPTAPFKEAHFATFPPALIEPCILAGCPVGGTVLDPFGGAGTTGLVADRKQRDAVLIELNPEYAAMAQRRIDSDRGGLLDAMEAA